MEDLADIGGAKQHPYSKAGRGNDHEVEKESVETTGLLSGSRALNRSQTITMRDTMINYRPKNSGPQSVSNRSQGTNSLDQTERHRE